MKKQATLEEIQRNFWKNLLTLNPSAEDLKPILREQEPLDVVERMKIYSEGYFLRILHVLQEDFKDTNRFLGQAFFAELVRAYLDKFISNHFSLRNMGARFPDFLKEHPSLRASPWVHELARFEWAKDDVFDGPDHNAVSLEELKSVPQDRWHDLRFKLIPNLTLLMTKYRIETLAERPVSSGRSRVKCELKTETLKIWRKDEEVYYALTTPDELKMFALVRTGKKFAEIGDVLTENLDAEATAHVVFTVLARWIDDRIIEKIY